MTYTWFFLYALHVFAGVFWIGAAVVITFFILPAVQATGPSGGAVMGILTDRQRLPYWITLAGMLTTLSGLPLFWYVNGGFVPDRLNSLADVAFTGGAILGVGAFLFGFLVQSPRAHRLQHLIAHLEQPPSSDQLRSIARLQRQLQVGGWFGVGLLVAALAGMVFSHPI